MMVCHMVLNETCRAGAAVIISNVLNIQWLILKIANNFPIAESRVALQTYVLQHIYQ